MTTYYVDPANGNDGNAGTSWGAAWKTVKGGATAANTAPGDFIKIAKSPAPVSMGTCSFNSGYVDLPSRIDYTINNCESATGWSNTTYGTVTTTSSYKMAGTNSLYFSIGANHTTGPVAYKNEDIDLSNYQKIQFWFLLRTYTGADGEYELNFYSDVAAGGTELVSIPIQSISSNDWVPVVYDHGSALPSNIKSFALCNTQDNGGRSVYVDQISAVVNNAPTLYSVISDQNTDEVGMWYPVKHMESNGAATPLTRIYFFSGGIDASNGGALFLGSTGSKTGYYIDPYIVTDHAIYIPEGSTSTFSTYSGGWDTGSDTQTGCTWFNIKNAAVTANAGIYRPTAAGGISPIVENVGILWAGLFTFTQATADRNATYRNCAAAGIFDNIFDFATASVPVLIDSCSFNGYNVIFDVLASSSDLAVVEMNDTKLFNGNGNNTIWPSQMFARNCEFRNLHNASTSGVYGNITFTTGQPGGRMRFYNCVFSDASGSKSDIALNGRSVFVELFNCSLPSGINLSGSNTVKSIKHNQIADNHKIYLPDGCMLESESTVIYDGGAATPTGISWKLTAAGDSFLEHLPLHAPIAQIPCAANSEVTVTAYFKRSSTSITASLVCYPYQIAGVTTKVSDSMTEPDTDNWEQLSISFTPTENGVVEIEAEMYGVDNGYIYIDDIDATQV